MRQLFVIGDSISMQYGPYLEAMTAGRYGYDRKRGERATDANLDRPAGANGGDSSMVLRYLTEQKEKGVAYDVLLLNCGLHDIKRDVEHEALNVSPEQYRRHLEQIMAVAGGMSGRIVWIRTTDVVDAIHWKHSKAFKRYHADVESFNRIADEVCEMRGIPQADLYSFTQAFGDEAYCDHVHYKDEVRRLQAAYLAGVVDTLLSSSSHRNGESES
ncbi:SGNH/GDSL hydrolase family protein [Paenibacillus sp. HB172176]|uniref:SGNH/GDSL hydrolase family protein n=1 Tax=Paenibacillus sp. HB172176 TaxID=2493690 RepID=UPI00143B5598|nr:SGNH/GDSL hydrolase family protein [Paenibacillus sp. HB172176]